MTPCHLNSIKYGFKHMKGCPFNLELIAVNQEWVELHRQHEQDGHGGVHVQHHWEVGRSDWCPHGEGHHRHSTTRSAGKTNTLAPMMESTMQLLPSNSCTFTLNVIDWWSFETNAWGLEVGLKLPRVSEANSLNTNIIVISSLCLGF